MIRPYPGSDQNRSPGLSGPSVGSYKDALQEQLLATQVNRLQEAIKILGDPSASQSTSPSLFFFVEIAPQSSRGSRCKLATCSNGPIKPGHYRIALSPSIEVGNFRKGKIGIVDLYHVSCFEIIADFTQVSFVNSLEPLTRENFLLRGIKGSSALDGNYIVDGGAERLLSQWKIERGRLIKGHNGTDVDTGDVATEFANFFSKPFLTAGQSEQMDEVIPGIITPFADGSDGPTGTRARKFFDKYLDTRKPGSLENRHGLSEMLTRWRVDRVSEALREANQHPEGVAHIRE